MYPNVKEVITDDGNEELWIPVKNVFTLTKKCKEKVSNYIIDLNNSASLYSRCDFPALRSCICTDGCRGHPFNYSSNNIKLQEFVCRKRQ